LAGRGLGEERYLEPLVATLESGQTQADRWLSLYHGDWGGDLSRIYQAASL
jgi:glutamate--cysteine ligase